MKHFLIIMAMVCSLTVGATIITVDNNYPSMGDYTTLQAAHDAANPGDTIVMFPSSFAYNGLVVTKQLSIYGSGWHSTQTVQVAIVSGNLSFNTGSQGSVLMGIYSHLNECTVSINTNNISVYRNQIAKIILTSNTSGTIIVNNYIYHTTLDHVIDGGDNLNATIKNNILINDYWGSGSFCVISGTNCQLDVLNNIVRAGNNYYPCHYSTAISSSCTGTIANNIFIYGQINTNGNCTMNNILSCTGWTGSNNLVNVNYDQLFINQAAGNYHLQPNSVASGSGYGGTDMGIYGGDFPFVDGGYPDLPAIYYLNVPSQASKHGGVNVTIKAKSNN